MGKRFRSLAPLHLEMMHHADAALASTQYLAERMRAAAPQTPVYTVRNFLSTETLSLSEAARRLPDRPSKPDLVTLGYLSGSPTHDEDFATAAEALRKVLVENEQAELLIVGPLQLPNCLADRRVAGQVRRMDAVDWRKLPELMAEQGVGINLAPLDLSRSFCHAKSEVKYLEAAALGIPTVASASEGFLEATADRSKKCGCFLAANTDDWVRFLNLLIQHDSERDMQGGSAYEQIHCFAAIEENRVKVDAVFAELAQRRKSDRPSTPSEGMVNWPFSLRYAVKGALERTAGHHRAVRLHRQKGS
jgi:glycosyltransferase involved in cell wall biosynthesis